MNTTAPRRALISGASVAGPVAAFWLTQAGWDVTVVERARHVRSGGYPIDVRGTAAEVVKRMGIHEDLHDRRVTRRTSSMVNRRGRPFVTMDVGDVISNVNSHDIELPRGELTSVLFDLTQDSVDYRFSTSIVELHQGPDAVSVVLSDGKEETYDVVIAADGIHSNTRRLVFGNEEQFIKHLGPCVAIYRLPADVTPELTNFMWNEPGRMISLAADTDGGNQAFIAFVTDDPGSIDVSDIESVAAAVGHAYAEDGWIVPSVVGAIRNTDDLYFDTVSQIRMDTWHSGRVAVVGDSAFAPAFLSGQGTSIAIIGAYVLATELAAHDDPEQAFGAYESRLREFIAKNQALAMRSGSVVLPRAAKQLRKRNRLFRLLPWMKRLGLLGMLGGQVREASNDLSIEGYGLRRTAEANA
jgi:2-polyprenyl-6-methoxyphenol hydroxylase-like FAD-dependent oxidoreductase